MQSPLNAAEQDPNPKNEGRNQNITQKQNDLIPRSVLFSDPDYTHVKLSHDGQQMSYLRPHLGVLNIWVGNPQNKESMHPITEKKDRGIDDYFWAYDNKHIIYFDDDQGNEDWRIYQVDVKTGKTTILASFKQVQARLISSSENFPDEILIGLNQRRKDLHDIYRLNIQTGKMDLVYENNDFSSFNVDKNFNVKIGLKTRPEGGSDVYTLDKNFAKTHLLSIDEADMLTTSPIFLDKSGEFLYLSDSRNRNTSALRKINLKTLKEETLAEDKKADIDNVILHPQERTLLGYSSTYDKTKWTYLDKDLAKDMDVLKQIDSGDIVITSQSLNNQDWIVAFVRDNASPVYYYYDRPTKKATFLFASRSKLKDLELSTMKPVIIESRDHYPMVSYLTLPVNAKTPVPLILLVHGGPNARDDWGYDSTHQWLSNRGYAVLAVNYRGSTGFGKAFTNAGNGEWGGKMHDDLIDAVEWAIKQGVTTRDKVAIMGGSYGGYATLVGLTKTPNVFALGVDIVGPSNLKTLMESIPAYWKPFYASLKNKIGGDPETDEGKKFLAERSPLSNVAQIKKPLLIGQGANDPRVKQAEAEQIVNKMQEKSIPVTYILYPDEGHGFQRPENRMSFNAVVEAFLAKYLGGKFEPIHGDFKNSSIQIKAGKEFLPKNALDDTIQPVVNKTKSKVDVSKPLS